MNELQSQITLALAVPIALQWLKGQSWMPLLSYYNGKVNAFVAAIVALLSSAGIAMHFDYAAHELIVTGLTGGAAWSIATHFFQQFIMQHAAYKAVIAPPLPGIEQARRRDNEKHGKG